MISKFNLKTPGREDDAEETKLYSRADFDKKTGMNTSVGSGSGKAATAAAENSTSVLLEKGLGGRDNISDIDCCATRLRITVKDDKMVDEAVLKQTRAAGVIKKGQGVQIIFGPQVTVIKADFEEYLG